MQHGRIEAYLNNKQDKPESPLSAYRRQDLVLADRIFDEALLTSSSLAVYHVLMSTARHRLEHALPPSSEAYLDSIDTWPANANISSI